MSWLVDKLTAGKRRRHRNDRYVNVKMDLLATALDCVAAEAAHSAEGFRVHGRREDGKSQESDVIRRALEAGDTKSLPEDFHFQEQAHRELAMAAHVLFASNNADGLRNETGSMRGEPFRTLVEYAQRFAWAQIKFDQAVYLKNRDAEERAARDAGDQLGMAALYFADHMSDTVVVSKSESDEWIVTDKGEAK